MTSLCKRHSKMLLWLAIQERGKNISHLKLDSPQSSTNSSKHAIVNNYSVRKKHSSNSSSSSSTNSALCRSQKPELNYYLIFSRNVTNAEPPSSPAIYPSTNGPPSSGVNAAPVHSWTGSPITPTSSPATAIPIA